MIYDTEQAPIEQRLIRDSLAYGKPLPEKIRNAPEKIFGSDFYYEAFFDLSSERLNSSAGLGRIPWSAVSNYCKTFDLDEDESEVLHAVIRSMDNAYLNSVSK